MLKTASQVTKQLLAVAFVGVLVVVGANVFWSFDASEVDVRPPGTKGEDSVRLLLEVGWDRAEPRDPLRQVSTRWTYDGTLMEVEDTDIPPWRRTVIAEKTGSVVLAGYQELAGPLWCRITDLDTGREVDRTPRTDPGSVRCYVNRR